jgi:hypothetical protein
MFGDPDEEAMTEGILHGGCVRFIEFVKNNSLGVNFDDGLPCDKGCFTAAFSTNKTLNFGSKNKLLANETSE